MDQEPDSQPAAKPPRWGKRLLLVLAALIVVGGSAAYVLYADYRAFLDQPMALSADGLTLEVKPGMGMIDLIAQLQRQPGLSRSRAQWYLQAHARLNGLASRLKAGEYALTPGLTPKALLDQIVAGRVIQYSLTVVEGWTFRQLRRALAQHPQITQTLRDASDAEIMARLGRPNEHPEGWFLPDTYRFPKGFTDESFLQRAMAAMDRRLREAWNRRSPDLPLTYPYEALILASIVEKETGLAQERPEIAGVFARRLRRGMLLQTDPTVIYGLGEAFDGNLRHVDLTSDNPYNTYTHKGLPPTPIALPGGEALAAAVNPAPGNTLYFVATGQGGHVFSTTLEEHNRAVRQYQQRKRP